MAENIVHAACSVHTPPLQMEKMRGEGIFYSFSNYQGVVGVPTIRAPNQGRMLHCAFHRSRGGHKDVQR